MKKIGNLLMQTYLNRAESQSEDTSNIKKSTVVDDQTVFYIFKKIVVQEYGSRGEQNIEARYFKNKKLIVATKNSLWGSELQLAREHFIQKINQEMGMDAVTEIKVESSFSS